MPEISRTYNNPLASHQARHHHDLRGTGGGPTSSQPGGAESEPSGGETRAEHEVNKPKHPVDEALRPAHVLGGEKNMGAPEQLDVKGQGVKGNLGEVMGGVMGDTQGRRQEGLGEGVGGLEGRRSGLEGAGER
ncbi:hypothetical protein B0T20DRAFT_49662 [Sordaria brevicollis]|uniref:Uncharacterized protein n=1 Tax=Sordaria brevicollis TaxID=83679 RepID=A0AAE0P9T3_SORBR|nr:hypothetical protein B0T20DRAFT_49662 [Sordaria brevicollis]